jgi:hypothetical protein
MTSAERAKKHRQRRNSADSDVSHGTKIANLAAKAPNPKGRPSLQGGQEQKFTEEEVRAALVKAGGIVTLAAPHSRSTATCSGSLR